eukprot:5956968-Prymnesium_polylepis.2
MKSPPAGVRLTMEMVCYMKGVKPKQVPNGSGGTVLDFWGPSKTMMSDAHFLQSLFEYDKDNIPASVIEKVKPHLGDPNFSPDVVAKSSKAAMGLCKWVRALVLYYDVSRVVGPKRIALAHSEEAMAETQAQLEEKKQSLVAVTAKLEQLTQRYTNVVKEKERLEREYNDCLRRMDHAQRLIGGLGGERTRWSQRSLELSDAYECLIGDVTVCAAIIGYLGPFTLTYRNTAINGWLEVMASKGRTHAPRRSNP